jgi:hypothetical protein
MCGCGRSPTLLNEPGSSQQLWQQLDEEIVVDEAEEDISMQFTGNPF